MGGSVRINGTLLTFFCFNTYFTPLSEVAMVASLSAIWSRSASSRLLSRKFERCTTTPPPQKPNDYMFKRRFQKPRIHKAKAAANEDFLK
jgi:hypothetical protein